MLFTREFTVRKHERGILFRNGDFQRFLAPAVYRFFDPGKRLDVERFDLTQPAFEHRLLDYLVRWQPEAVEDLFLRVETGAGEIAVVYRNGHPWTFVAPERRALFWKGVVHVKAELIDVTTDVAVPRRIAQACITERQTRRASAFGRDLRARGARGPRWTPVRRRPARARARARRARVLENRPQLMRGARRPAREGPRGQRAGAAHQGQGEPACASERELPVPRVQLTVRNVRDPVDFLYKEIQLGLRSAVAKRSLDALLEHKSSLDRDVFTRVHDKLAALGIDLREIGVNELARIAL